MRIIKKREIEPMETTITISYNEWDEELEDLQSYIEGNYQTISGYNQRKSLCVIPLKDILYFEAVGELVFAYTKNNVYEIKMRLYKIEEKVNKYKIIRASKSILINIPKIEQLKSALNGRMLATMVNGEQIMISRAYARELVARIKMV
ncbi:MAG: LytTR family DNA-binding domain-containing protein [Bacillota bacterium]|nr:LytTR family DNA-binding domain-containing protein [Bacillota bacterium]